MKRWIRAKALLGGLLLSTAVVAAPSSNADNNSVAQLLDQLGVRALLEQAPAVLAASIEAQAQNQSSTAIKSPSSSPNWRRELEAQLSPQLLAQAVQGYVNERQRADMLRAAQQRLQEPLAKRARYFDLAMTQPGAEKNLREFLAQHKVERGSGVTSIPDSDARRAVLSEIDKASAMSALMATLQSAIAQRVQLAATGDGGDAALLKDAIAERQRYLAPLATEYLLYDYRYLRDDELHEYRDLLRDEAVQWLLDVCRQAVLAAVSGEAAPAGEITPLPGRPR